MTKQCKHIHAWEDKYTDFVKLASIKNAQSDEFVVRVPFYVQGVRDARILVSSDQDKKNAYEIGACMALAHKETILNKRTVYI